jgi:hypothetical protein
LEIIDKRGISFISYNCSSLIVNSKEQCKVQILNNNNRAAKIALKIRVTRKSKYIYLRSDK